MAGDQGHGELFAHMLGDVLLGTADDLILGIDGVGGAQLGAGGGDLLPQQLQQQKRKLLLT